MLEYEATNIICDDPDNVSDAGLYGLSLPQTFHDGDLMHSRCQHIPSDHPFAHVQDKTSWMQDENHWKSVSGRSACYGVCTYPAQDAVVRRVMAWTVAVTSCQVIDALKYFLSTVQSARPQFCPSAVITSNASVQTAAACVRHIDRSESKENRLLQQVTMKQETSLLYTTMLCCCTILIATLERALMVLTW
jgi:hypothetical protein